MTTIDVAGVAGWRSWLAENSRTTAEVWLVLPAGSGAMSYHQAIEQALCFGWIDSHARKGLLRFTPRNPRSTWSELNRRRAADMIEQGLMTPDGQALIDLAQAEGRWHSPTVPDDLREMLDRDDAARGNFERFPPSSRRLILEWITGAKRPETRQRRIERTVSLAAENVRAV